MRKRACVGCLFALLAVASCTTAPVGKVVYRAWCENDATWLGQQWHLTAAEADAQVALHRCEQPEHATLTFSTNGPVTIEAADVPPGNAAMRSYLIRRSR